MPFTGTSEFKGSAVRADPFRLSGQHLGNRAKKAAARGLLAVGLTRRAVESGGGPTVAQKAWCACRAGSWSAQVVSPEATPASIRQVSPSGARARRTEASTSAVSVWSSRRVPKSLRDGGVTSRPSHSLQLRPKRGRSPERR